jgi:hypothetical protein
VAQAPPGRAASKRWSWLAALAVLFAGITNAHSHVHYCFDGQEPPAAVHLVDVMDHHHDAPGHAHDGHSDDGAGHDDLDVDLPNQASLAKAAKYDVPAIDVVAWTMPFESLPPGALVASVDTPPAPSPRYALPRLRAPPR